MSEWAVVIENLRYQYGQGPPALQGISLRVRAGECIAVIGPNGAGKSTLLLHLNGLLRGEGRVVVNGWEVTRGNLSHVRRSVGLVFQDPDDQLFLPTCLEDVAFGPLNEGLSWREALERAREALSSVGMLEAADRPPHQLSVGQRKRVALATVLAMRPAILAFDEPSAGLDPAARRQFIRLIRTLPQTRLIATHDLAMVEELCERAILLDSGRLIADAPTANLLANKELLFQYRLEPPGYREVEERLPQDG